MRTIDQTTAAARRAVALLAAAYWLGYTLGRASGLAEAAHELVRGVSGQRPGGT